MKQFFAFIKKEFYHILRDTRTIMILLIMPVIQIILFGFAISTEVKNIRTLILAPNYDIAVQQIVDRLESYKSSIRLKRYSRLSEKGMPIWPSFSHNNTVTGFITRNNTYKL